MAPTIDPGAKPRREGALTCSPLVEPGAEDPFEAQERAAGAVRLVDLAAEPRLSSPAAVEEADGAADSAGYEQESERIRRSAERPEAAARHKFREATWTHPNGHPRCRVCGGEERIGGICNGKPTREEAQAWCDRQNRSGTWGDGSRWTVGRSGEPSLDLAEAFDAVKHPRGRGGKWRSLEHVEAAHPGVTLFATEHEWGIRLHLIRTPRESQGRGLAGRALESLHEYADQVGKPVYLTPGRPEGNQGISNAQLKAWYRRRGYVPHTGRRRDFRATGSMVRPASVEEARLRESLFERWAALLVEEGAYWDPEKHPRWPKGTPLAGQFMKVGQRFELNGKEYDVTAVLPGRIHANVATKGHAAGAQSVSLTTAQLEQATRPKAEAIKSSTKQTTSASAAGGKSGTATVLDPYVDHGSHDASIPIPPAAKALISPEQWKRFGRLDQEKFSQLVERFGGWSQGKSSSLISAAMAAADGTTKKVVSDGYKQGSFTYEGQTFHGQKGSSSGEGLSLHYLFASVASALKGEGKAEKARDKYERARELQGEVASAMQWDLYHRTGAPDVALFHKHNSSPGGTFDQVLAGQKPVFSGLSMSQHYRKGWWANNCFAVPMAIRHVVMSTVSGNVTPGYESEQEVAVADPFAVKNGRGMNWSDSSFNAGKLSWLEGHTHHAASGEMLDMLQRSMTDPTFELPIPPAKPVVQMDSQGGKGWKQPPAAATSLWKSWGTKTNDSGETVADVKWVHAGADGKPKADQAIELGLIPGDYIQGNPGSPDKGTIYVIVKDPTDSVMGLAYYKLTEPDGVTAAGSSSVYHFDQGGTTKFKKIEAHFDIEGVEKAQAEQSGQKTFQPEAWAEGIEKKLANQLKPGDKFEVHASYYEIVDASPGASSVKIKDLGTGELGQINGDYKTPTLGLKPGWSEHGESFDPAGYFGAGEKASLSTLGLAEGDIVQVSGSHFKVQSIHEEQAELVKLDGHGAGNVAKTPLAALDGAKLTPKPLGWSGAKVGDSLAVAGKKAKVTKIMADGTVQLNLQPGVMKVKPDDPVLAGLFSPEAHDLSGKVKLRDLAPGDKFHGGTGSKLRPYMVVSHDPKSKKSLVRNLDTGEESHVSSLKSFQHLVPKAHGSVAPAEDGHSTPAAADSHDPQAWEHSHEGMVAALQEGDVFSKGGVVYKVTSTEGKGEALNLATGASVKIGMDIAVAKTSPVSVMKPKGSEALAHGEMPAMDFQVGDFLTHDGQTYKVYEKSASGGLNAEPVDAAGAPTGGGHLAANPDWPFAKAEPPATTASSLEIGDHFLHGGVAYEHVGTQFGPDGAVLGKSVAGGHTNTIPGDSVVSKLPTPSSAAAAGPDPEGFSAAPGVKIGDLEVGDQIKGHGGTVWELTGPMSNGSVPATVIASPGSPSGLGKETQLNPLTEPPLVKKASAAGPVETGSEFGNLAVGGHFNAHGAVWEKTSLYDAKIVSVYGKEQGAPPGWDNQFASHEEVGKAEAPSPPAASSAGASPWKNGATGAQPIEDMWAGDQYLDDGVVHTVVGFKQTKGVTMVDSSKAEATHIQVEANGQKLVYSTDSTAVKIPMSPATSAPPADATLAAGETLAPGDHFAFAGDTWKMTSKKGNWIHAENVSTGEDGQFAAKGSFSKVEAPGPPPGHVWAGSLKPGDKFDVPDGDENPWTVESVGEYVVATSASGKKLPFGVELPVTKREADGPALTQNPDGKSVAELGLEPGDKVELYNGSNTITKVYGEPGTDGHVYDAVQDATGEKGTFGTGGKPSAFLKATPGQQEPPPSALADVPAAAPATAYDPSAYASGGKKKLAELEPGDVFVGPTNGKHYMVKKTGAKSGLSAIDLMTGNKSEPWGYEKVAEALHPKAKGAVASYEQLAPGDPVQIGQLKAGDHVKLGGSSSVYEIVEAAPSGVEQPQVTIAPVHADYTLGAPGTANTYPMAVVTFHAHSGDVAAAKAQLAQAAAEGKVLPPPKEVDPAAHPDAATAGLTAFSAKSKTGGGYFFTKAKLAGEGTLLMDKSGQVWKVKVPGSYPIVSNGQAHFHVDGDHNLKVVEGHPFDDQAGPLHGASVQDTAAEVAQALEVPAAGAEKFEAFSTLKDGQAFVHAGATWQGHAEGDKLWAELVEPGGQYSPGMGWKPGGLLELPQDVLVTTEGPGLPQKLGSLGLEEGHTFTSAATSGDAAGTWKVTGIDHEIPGWATTTNVLTGQPKTFGPTHPVASFSKAGFAGYEPGDKVLPSKLKTGDWIETSHGTTYQIASHVALPHGDGAWVALHHMDSGTTYEAAEMLDLSHADKPVWTLASPTKKQAKASVAQAFDPAGWEPDYSSYKDSSELMPGDVFMHPEDGSPIMVLPGKGAKTVATTNGFAQMKWSKTAGSVTVMKAAGTSPAAPEPEDMPDSERPIGEVPVGALVSAGTPGAAVWKVTGHSPGGGVAYVELAKPSAVDDAPVGTKASFPLDLKVSKAVIPPDPAPAATPEPDFSPNTSYASGFGWTSNGGEEYATPVGMLPPGTHVTGVGGTVFMVGPGDEQGKVTLTIMGDVHPGDAFYTSGPMDVGSTISASSGWFPAKIDSDAAYPSPNPDDYTETGKGNVGDLAPGSHFKSAVGEVYQVVGHKDDQTHVIDVSDGAHLSTPSYAAATFVSPSGFDPAVHGAPPGLAEKHGLAPNALGLKLSDLAQGSLFQDSHGQVWKVESDPAWNDGNADIVMVDHPFSPGLIGSSSFEFGDLVPTHVGAGEPALHSATSTSPGPAAMGELKTGDKFEHAGTVYHVVATPEEDEFEFDEDGPELVDDSGDSFFAADVFDGEYDPNQVVNVLPGDSKHFDNGTPTPVWSLEPGMKFTHDGVTYEVSGTNDEGDLELVDEMGLKGTAREAFGKKWMEAKVAVLNPYAEGPDASQAPPVLAPNATGQPVGALAVGDHFQTDGGSVFQVTAKPPSGIVGVKLVHGVMDDPVSGTNDFGPTYVPAGIHGGSLPSAGKHPGDRLAPNQAVVGDVFTSGDTYKVVGKTSDPKWAGYTLHLEGLSGKSAGKMFDMQFLGGADDDEQTWTISDAAAPGPAAPAGSSGAPAASQLTPYSPKSETGGGYYFGKVAQLAPGTQFTDKKGGVYEKVGTVGGQHVFKDATGQQFAAAGHEKVKLLQGKATSTSSVPPELAQHLTDLSKVPDVPEHLLAGFPDSPYSSDGQVIGKSIADVRPGAKFDSVAQTWQMVGKKDGWFVIVSAKSGAPWKTKGPLYVLPAG